MCFIINLVFFKQTHPEYQKQYMKKTFQESSKAHVDTLLVGRVMTKKLVMASRNNFAARNNKLYAPKIRIILPSTNPPYSLLFFTSIFSSLWWNSDALMLTCPVRHMQWTFVQCCWASCCSHVRLYYLFGCWSRM